MGKKVRCKLCNKEFDIIAPNHLSYKHGVSFPKYRKAFPTGQGGYWADPVRERQSDNFEDKWQDKKYRSNQKRSSRANTMTGNKNALRRKKK